MSKLLKMVALALALAAAGVWLATGANQGWTKTSVAKKTVDEVTGLEAISYERRFVPGLDFLGGSLLGATTLAGASLLFRKKSTTNGKTQNHDN